MYYWQTTKTSYEPVICEPVKKKTTHYSLLRPAENTVGDLFHTVEPTDIYYLVMENTFLLSYSIVVWIKQELFGFFSTWLKKVIACFWNTPVPCAGIPDANQNPVRVRLTPERPFQPPQIPNKWFLHSFTHFENKNYYISCS